MKNKKLTIISILMLLLLCIPGCNTENNVNTYKNNKITEFAIEYIQLGSIANNEWIKDEHRLMDSNYGYKYNNVLFSTDNNNRIIKIASVTLKDANNNIVFSPYELNYMFKGNNYSGLDFCKESFTKEDNKYCYSDDSIECTYSETNGYVNISAKLK